MNTLHLSSTRHRQGNVLIMVVVMAAGAMMILAGVLGWARSSVDLTARNNQYNRSLVAAEAATEKLIAHVGSDFQNYGVALVNDNLGTYRTTVPTTAEFAHWGNFVFQNEKGEAGQTTVDFLPTSTSTVLSMKYAGLRGFAYDMRIVSQAREVTSQFQIIGRNERHLSLSLVPVFQYAIFYNKDLEFNRCAPMSITGPVHCNASIYGAPATTLSFNGQVTAAGKILIKQKKPGDNLTLGSGTTSFNAIPKPGYKEKVPSLNLPLGTNNTPGAVHQIVEIPPWNESASSLMGQLRYYNLADMVILVSNNNVTVKSGAFNNFFTSISWTQASYFIKTNAKFYDRREDVTITTTDIDVDKLRRWNATNAYRTTFPNADVQSIYVADCRVPTGGGGLLGGLLGGGSNKDRFAVRLINGECLPPKGLTVATFNPLYIQGHYNVCTNASSSATANASPVNLGTSDTTKTRPASVASDCLTILSEDWSDSEHKNNGNETDAENTTINVAILAGNTETVSSFGGGVHNLPRYLEQWSGVTFTLNTSIVSMFPAQLSSGPFVMPGSSGSYYSAPTRNWSFDLNFNDPNKLPPITPTLRLMVRGSWGD